MAIDKSKVFTLFALTLLIVALLSVNMNGPVSPASASIPPSQPINVHGPSLTPVHMHGPALTPVHMHHKGGILQWGDSRLYQPNCTTDWTELYPNFGVDYHLSSWKDNGDKMLSPCDQIDMTDMYGKVTWYHVDRMTVTLLLSPLPGPPAPPPNPWPGPAEPTIAIELKWPTYFPEIKYENNLPPYLITKWHEVWSSYSNVYNLTSWMENPLNPTFKLDPCDVVDLTDIRGKVTWWHVEDVATDLILNEKIMDPVSTDWHEVYPEYCTMWHVTSWKDTGEPFGELSPCDQIDMNKIGTELIEWYHVDRVTLTLNVTIVGELGYYLFEYKGPFEGMYKVKTTPVCTYWHMVWPEYSEVVHLEAWEDNCNGVLDHCDYVTLSGVRCHVEGLYIDLILNKKIANPVCTDWQELYPYFDNWYHVIGWEDNKDGVLSPCDYVNLTLAGGPTAEYHVETVTLTLNVTYVGVPGEFYLFEYQGPFENMYQVKTNPLYTDWMEIWPFYGYPAYVENWTDNCNGVLDHCDRLQWEGVWFHVEELAIDMVVVKLIHDVAVTAVSSLYPWVYEGEIDPISVTITNLGDYNEPTVNVYAFYDGNLAAPVQTTSLNIGETKTLIFNWDTTGVPPGFYTVSAKASILIDDVPANNILSDGVQEVRERPPPSPLPKIADVELYPREVVDLEDPRGTQWHELYPNETNYYKITSWKPGKVLSPEDWVVMMDGTPFEVDDVTIDIVVKDLQTGAEYWMDYECGYWTFDPTEPKCTKWHEIKNHDGEPAPMPRCWHLTSWIDESGDGKLSYCDIIDMTPMYPYTPYTVWFHVEQVTVTLKLTELGAMEPVQHYLDFVGTLEDFQAGHYIHHPEGTMWLEILPDQGRPWFLMMWMDRPFLSPSDLVVLNLKDPVTQEPIPGVEAEYHVDKLTVAMHLTSEGGEHIVKFEGSLLQFKKYHWRYPIGTQWHEVNPQYCRQWYILDWYESQPNGILDYCDWIYMIDKNTGWKEWFHVESLSTDMWLTMAVCDVEVTSVVPETRYAYPRWTNDVYVTVHNNGTVTFNCTVTLSYYDGSTWIAIATQSVTYLDPCNTVTLKFAWSLAGVPYCNRTLKAEATCTCGDTDEGYSWVKVKMPGDVDADGDCDADDVFTYVSPSYGKKLGQPGFNKQTDFDDDNDCDADDVFTYLSPNYGKKYTCK